MGFKILLSNQVTGLIIQGENQMIKIESSVTINRPVEDIFEFIADNDNDTLWQSGVTESEQPTGSMGVGATYKQVSKVVGREIESTIEVTEYDPNRRFAFKTTSGPLPMAGSFTCEQVAEGETKVHILGEGESGGLFKLAEPVINKMVQREWETNLANLKDLMEAQE